ncbi:DUF2339 domain-containing protein, partial [Myxococcota bacterium]|nr:DUF2339 domain-containing protein [Myxococcota bacterium]
GSYFLFNPAFLGIAMISLSGFFVSWQLQRVFTGRTKVEAILSPFYLVYALLWWIVGFFFQADMHHLDDYFSASGLAYFGLTALILGYVASKSAWVAGKRASLAFIPSLWIFAGATITLDRPSQYGGFAAWPFALATSWRLLWRHEKAFPESRSLKWLHALAWPIPIFLFSAELDHWLKPHFEWDSAWSLSYSILPLLAALYWSSRASHWPFSTNQKAYRLIAGSLLVALSFFWAIASMGTSAAAQPLPWMPLLNPLDMVWAFWIATLIFWWRSILEIKPVSSSVKTGAYITLGAILFVWPNVLLLRGLHHWFGLDYDFDVFWESALAQASVSILWTIGGMAIILISRRLSLRWLWIVGGSLLGVVVLKLFKVDLNSSGSLERIVSFLAVGLLLVLVGYFAAIPEKPAEPEADKEDERVEETEAKDDEK